MTKIVTKLGLTLHSCQKHHIVFRPLARVTLRQKEAPHFFSKSSWQQKGLTHQDPTLDQPEEVVASLHTPVASITGLSLIVYAVENFSPHAQSSLKEYLMFSLPLSETGMAATRAVERGAFCFSKSSSHRSQTTSSLTATKLSCADATSATRFGYNSWTWGTKSWWRR